MVTIQWKSDNGIYLFAGNRGGFYLPAPIETTISSVVQAVRSPLRDGRKTYNPVLDRMVIRFDLAVEVRGTRNVNAFIMRDEIKNTVAEAFSPKRYGELICYNNAGEQYARCLPTQTPRIKSETSSLLVYDVELVSDYATWLGEKKEEFIGRKENLLLYPVTYPATYGSMIPGCIVMNTSRSIAYPVFEVSTSSAQFGVENQTTGKSFTLNHAIAAGEKAVIDTYENTVYLMAADGSATEISHYLDGDFVTLAPGKNILESHNDTLGDVPNCRMIWREQRMCV